MNQSVDAGTDFSEPPVNTEMDQSVDGMQAVRARSLTVGVKGSDKQGSGES